MKIKSTAATGNNPVPCDFVDPEAYFENPSLFEGINTCPDAIDISGDSLDSSNHQLRSGGFEINASTNSSRVTVKTPFDDMNDNWVNLINNDDEVEEWEPSSPSEQARSSNELNTRRAPQPPMTKTRVIAVAANKATIAANNGGPPPPIPARPAIPRRSPRNSSSSSSANPTTTIAAPQPQQQPVGNRVPAFMTLGGGQTTASSSSPAAARATVSRPLAPPNAASSAACFFQPSFDDVSGRTVQTLPPRPAPAAEASSVPMMNPPLMTASGNPPSKYPVVSPFQSMMMAGNHGPGFTIPPPLHYPSIQGLTSSINPPATMTTVNRPPPFNPSYKADASHRKTGWVDVDEVDPHRKQDMSSEHIHRKQRELDDARYARMLQEEEESATEAKRLREEQERMSLQIAIELMEEENRQKQMEDEFQLQCLQQQFDEELAEEEARRIALEMEGAEVARMLAAQEQMAYEEQRRLEEEGLKVAMALQKEEEEEEERRLRQLEEERLRLQREAEAREAERKRKIWMATPDARFVGKRCPNCRQIIYKDVGCDSVKCVCGKTFNYGTAEVISNVPTETVPMAIPAPNSGTSPASSASAGEQRRRSSRPFGSLFRRAPSQQPEPTIPIARPAFGQQPDHDDTDCGAARAPTGPRPAFLDDFLKNIDGAATRGSYECFMCNDRQSDVFFHCCKGIVCSPCTREWLKDNQTCPKCRAQLTRPPEKLVLN